ncbi:Berberine bridge enzyme-like 8 [Linum grandiflorum]
MASLTSAPPPNPTEQIYLKSLSDNSSTPIDQVIYFPTAKLYTSILKSNIRNLIFASDSTPRPLFIVAPTHLSHIQSTILCCKTHSLQLRIRSGGHDYDGLSYTSSSPFALLDLHNYNSVAVDLDSQTAWVDSGATVGEVYHQIAAKSRTHAFPGGVCPTVGVGGFLSGAGYGNLMRKYGLSVDNVLDAVVVDADGQLIADKLPNDLFIRVVLIPVAKHVGGESSTVKAKFNAMFLGNRERLVGLMEEQFPELISKPNLEWIWKKMVESGKTGFVFNPYGGRMDEIAATETPFPHRKGNLWKIQFSIGWKEAGETAEKDFLSQIRRIYSYMTPFVSKNPRGAYLNYSYAEGKVYGEKYFGVNFERLVKVKTAVDPSNFFWNEQSIPVLPSNVLTPNQ